jgi:hypothetical protein
MAATLGANILTQLTSFGCTQYCEDAAAQSRKHLAKGIPQRPHKHAFAHVSSIVYNKPYMVSIKWTAHAALTPQRAAAARST